MVKIMIVNCFTVKITEIQLLAKIAGFYSFTGHDAFSGFVYSQSPLLPHPEGL
jgi:hypothetical protein